MSSAQRSRRMARNHRRMARPAKLNLVALMDIFTILVLFLIVNNGDVEVLQSDRDVTLPDSVSEQRPQAALVIKLTRDTILLDDRPAGSIGEALAAPGDTVEELARALRNAVARDTDNPVSSGAGRHVIVMGDRDTPYALLQRVLATCAANDFRDISMAVNSAPAADFPMAVAGTAVAGTAQ